MSIVFIIFLACIILYCIHSAREVDNYNKSQYRKITKNSFWDVEFDKGKNGEYKIYKSLFHYEMDGASFLFNCYLPMENKETTEIDAIMIHHSGIYVFESKNYGGWIFGNERNAWWTQSLLGEGYSAQKERFYNPVWQNRTHIKYLRKKLGLFDGKIYSVIVFSDRCEFKDVTIFSDDVILTQQFQLAASIQKYTNKTIFNQEKINKYYDLLYPYTQLTEEQKQEHIKNLQERMNLRRLQQNKVCPRCGSKLVLRVAKKGALAGHEFYGCANYPKCRYTENKK